ncbi:MAG TPA: ABC transporter ATP-binding protein, partial [Planctomycetaceae bacterium]
LPMPLVVFASWYFTRYLHPRHHHYWEAVGKQAAALAGMLSGIRVVKSFTQEEREFGRFRESSERLRGARQNVDVSTSTFSALMAFLFGLGGLIVWYVGGRDVLGERMTLGSLMAFLAYLAMFYTPLTSLAESTTWISNFLTASQRIFELIDTPNDVTDPDPPRRPEPFRGGVRFEHVTFGYGDGEPVLKDVDFEVRPGEMIGLVGRSGSGKSTLVSLIGRMYDPKAGRVLVDGIDVRDMKRQELRRRVGIVLQDPFLFRGSLAANITYGQPEAPPEQVIRAAKSAYAHDFIMRAPFAYDSQVGEGGSGLSGGERQRISIARALLYDPRILILDEATSSVDTESEQAIQDALREFSKGRTTIAIAHRLSTLRDADRLLVFDRGRLVEQGTHDELLARGGVYASLVNIQTSLRKGVRQLQAAGVPAGPNGGPLGIAPEDVGPDAGLFDGDPESPDDPENGDRPNYRPRWLDPATAAIRWEEPDGLCLEENGAVLRGLHAAYAFPATHPEGYVSLRRRDPLGGDQEAGLVRLLAEWPEPARKA